MTSDTSAAIQTCTAETRLWEHRDINRDGFEPCGEPVAELGRCRVLIDDLPPTQGRKEYCGRSKPQHEALGEDHDYKGTLTHVPLGSCETCGHDEYYDSEGEKTHYLSGVGPMCIECTSGEGDDGNPLPGPCVYAPTLTERTDLTHEAEVSG